MNSYKEIIQEQKLLCELSKNMKDMYEHLYFRQDFNVRQDYNSKKHNSKQTKNTYNVKPK